MSEVTTTIRVRIMVPELDPRDPKDWAEVIEDHLWETFGDNGSLISVEYVPEPPRARSFNEELQRGMRGHAAPQFVPPTMGEVARARDAAREDAATGDEIARNRGLQP